VPNLKHTQACAGSDSKNFASLGLRRAATRTGWLIKPKLGGG